MNQCNETITLYNAKFDKESDSEKYNRTVIKGVSWFGTVKSTVDASGLKAANQITIRIPAEAAAEEKTYLTPREYALLVDTAGYFTLNEGDIIVKGIVEEENSRPANLKKVYSEIMTILAVTDNRSAPRAKHFKVVGA
jgi:hypothetical protein